MLKEKWNSGLKPVVYLGKGGFCLIIPAQDTLHILHTHPTKQVSDFLYNLNDLITVAVFHVSLYNTNNS